MDATCTDTRERATATAGSAAEESWSLLVKTERSKTPCSSCAGRTCVGRTGAVRALAGAQGGTSSETGKVGNIVSAEREGRLGFDSLRMLPMRNHWVLPATNQVLPAKNRVPEQSVESMGDNYAGNCGPPRLQMPPRGRISGNWPAMCGEAIGIAGKSRIDCARRTPQTGVMLISTSRPHWKTLCKCAPRLQAVRFKISCSQGAACGPPIPIGQGRVAT